MVSTDPLLDEDGRCRKTDLPPEMCGCMNHRGGEAINIEDAPRGGRTNPVRYDDYTVEELYVAWTMNSQFSLSACQVCGHYITKNTLIGLLKVIETDEEVTWCCEACVAKHQART